MNYNIGESITALVTPSGQGGTAMIRLSGTNALDICNNLVSHSHINTWKSHTIHYTDIYDQKNTWIDEVVMLIYLSPNTYTGENVVEICCHNSPLIIQKILKALFHFGAYPAGPGEFTMRAFLNGKMDLVRAEAVADIISCETETQHNIAAKQLKGHVSNQLIEIRDKMVELAALIELENDFSQEDVEFADKSQLRDIAIVAINLSKNLIDSFDYGNAIKNGISVTIIGRPNVGKSTLLNHLLKEDRAIVSDIPGTTRDAIEDVCIIEGIEFRFIDTAGIRHTQDQIENLGIKISFDKIKKAEIVLQLVDPNDNMVDIFTQLSEIEIKDNQYKMLIINKIDTIDNKKQEEIFKEIRSKFPNLKIIEISAKQKDGIINLEKALIEYIESKKPSIESATLCNVRHLQNLITIQNHLQCMIENLDLQLSSDILAYDLHKANYFLGLLTGTISNDELLDLVFSRFCIGK